MQIEADRIATGTTKLVPIENLYSEIGWETLETRRKKKQKKKNVFSSIRWLITWRHSTYQILFRLLLLKLLVTTLEMQMLPEQSTHELPNITTLFYHLQSVNGTPFPKNREHSATLLPFKAPINQHSTSIPKYYYSGNRQSQILHTRLRTKCSCLNYDVYLKNLPR